MTLTFDEIASMVSAAIGHDVPVRRDDDLIERGLDSIGVMKLAAQWQARGVDISYGELLEHRTLAGWWALIEPRVGPPTPASVPRGRETDAPFPLAPMQRAYWFGRDPSLPLGTECHVYLEFDGIGVDPDRLAAAVRALFARHDMLRARFRGDGQQEILAVSPWRGLTVHDLRGLDEATAERALRASRERESVRRFAVADGEVFDVQLSLREGGRTRMHVNIAMLAADALSFRILLGDLAALYGGAELAPLAVSYADALAERTRRHQRSYDAARAYWRAQLDALAGAPQLPLVPAAAQPDTPEVTRRGLWLDGAAREALAIGARAHGLTLSMTLAAAFAEVVAAWSNEPRVLVNLPLFDREGEGDLWRIVGDFTSSILLTYDGAGPGGFVGRARALQEQLRRGVAHATYPGVEVLQELTREGREATAPVVFTSAVGLGELVSRDVAAAFGDLGWMISQTAQVLLDHQVTEVDGRLLLNWDAVEPRFADGVLDAMFEAYQQLLTALAAPTTSWETPLATLVPPSQAAVRAALNATGRGAADRRLHDGFLHHAATAPERPALVSAAGEVTSYGALSDRARRLAARLRQAGVAPGDHVGVSAGKGPGQVEAVLAILLAGAAYVPLAIDHPPAHLARLIERARIRVALGDGAVALPAPVEVIHLGDYLDVAPLAPLPAIAADAPAYVLFTSGSTGEPKGVVVSHRAAMNTIDALVERFAIGPDDRGLAVSALDFDLAVFDIFALLSAGGAVVSIDEAARRDAQRWAALVTAHRVTIWQSVPAVLEMLIAAGGDRDLRLALLGGDWVAVDLRARLAPGCRLVALGGATEAAIHSTIEEVTAVPFHWTSIPYGVPLPNVACRVVGPDGRDRPDWVAGELWIGGCSLADGYLGDPARTAAVFVEHDGRRWYRTGDRARYWPDGRIELLGRLDDQIKLRGHRIELGQIESALGRHPAVRQAVAVGIGAPPTRIAAAVVVDAAAAVDGDTLRGVLLDELPGYMVPDDVVVLDALPLSGQGKIDRRAIARRCAERPAEPPGQPPRGECEETVAALWCELLDVPAVARDVSFFAAGGDSLLATRMTARLAALGYTGADLRRLFSTPRLADFCAGLRRGDAPAPVRVIADLHADRHAPFPLTNVQRAYWLGRQPELELGGVGSFWYWEFDAAEVDLPRLEAALGHLIARHEMLRVVLDGDGGQRVLPEVPPYRIVVDEARGPEAEALAQFREQRAHQVLDPTVWPLFQIRGLRYGAGRTRLGFGFDYVVLDALSITNLFAELGALYLTPDATLPPIGVSFRDYVLQVPPDAAARERARAHWESVLPHLPLTPRLPLAIHPSAVTAPRFRRREVHLDAAAWSAIGAQAKRRELTPSAVVATAFADVLSAWSADDDLTLNVTLFDRRDVHPDIDRVVGDFTSLVLVPYRPGAGTSWATRVRAMQEETWTSLEHRAWSALDVLRALRHRERDPNIAMPVVFTSTLGVTRSMVSLEMPFGSYAGGLSQTPQVWLDCQVIEHDGALLVNWDAVDALFPAGLLDEVFAAFVARLRWAAANDWADVPPVPLPEEQRAVRAAINATAGELAGTLHQPFFERAAATPDAPALHWGDDGRHTYGAVSDAALRIAGWLVAQGVEPGDAIALVLPKGPAQVVATLGTLAAGAVYVPIAVDEPADRRGRIIANAAPRLVVTDVAPALAAAPLARPVAVSPDALAYVIFTSGTTGQPKGVEITHQAAANTIADLCARHGLGASDRVLALSSPSFDLSVFDIFAPLAAGGAAVVVEEEDRRAPHRWTALAARWQVTVWNSVPALLDVALEQPARDWAAHLRLVMVSGDWVGLGQPAAVAALAPQARFVALGGATEAAIWSVEHVVDHVAPHWRSIPYGRPLRNQRLRIVDRQGHDRPAWVPGELWIGGAGVARGYRGDAALTAERFVSRDGARWYRTGDLARWWPDGTVELLGRADTQLKIHGNRIELGEIEAALAAVPELADAVVVGAGERHRRLVGYLVPRAGVTDDVVPLAEAALRRRLPSYMVPEQLVVLDRLPLTGNGKVDRAALARREPSAPAAGVAAPEGAHEAWVAALWADVLGVPVFDRHASFFALGGDSLQAMRVAQMVRLRRGVDLSLRQILEAHVLANLAATIAGHELPDGTMEDGVL